MLTTSYTETLNHTRTSKRTNNDKFTLTIKLNVEDNYSSVGYKDVVSKFRKLEEQAVRAFNAQSPEQERSCKKGGDL